MMSNALKFHQVGSDFYALSLSIQKYIEDNIVQIQERLLSENMNKQTSTDSQTKQQPRVDQNIDGGLSEDSAVKARPLTEKEKEGLASSVAELFKVVLLANIVVFILLHIPILAVFRCCLLT